MAFQQGLSGLNISAKALDVISNNVANASTVGFKGAQAQFADVFAASLGAGGGASQVGIGGNLTTVAQQFVQGNLTVTNNPLDLAINGNGFFRVQPNLADQSPSYTRNGQFHVDEEGYIVNAQNMMLTGYSSPDGKSISTATIGPIQLNTASIPPQPTGWSNLTNPGSGGIKVGLNLDNRDTSALTLTPPTTAAQKDLDPWGYPISTNMYNYSTSVSIYDQAGTAHALSLYFTRVADKGASATEWEVHAVLDNAYDVTAALTNADGTAIAGAPTLQFTESGVLDTSVLNNGEWSLNAADLASAGTIQIATGAAANAVQITELGRQFALDIPMDFNGTTQFGSPYDVNKLVQDGYAAGRLTGLSVDDSGKISGRYSNGQTQLMGQLVLATFVNNNGLMSMGNNLWSATAESGPALEGVPNAGSRGFIRSATVEESNIDLTNELVNMITMQRNYQANAQSIKTQDQIMQTLVNLR